jgi:pimeloyl-ACP methyl ester carboxylesterase
MKKYLLIAGLSAASLLVAGDRSARAQATSDPLEIVAMGSFHVGGRIVEVSGKPVKEVVFTPGGTPAKVDPNGKYLVESMYVQHFTPKTLRSPLPVLMWHGGGLSGVSYETTPDGREGWQTYFLRKGFKVFTSDAVERGRSGFASPDIWTGEPIFLPLGNPWERFRIGPGEGSWSDDPAKRKQLPGSQFPAEGYENFMRQGVPRWTTTDAAINAAYLSLVDRVCPCIVVVHSQAGQFGQRVAQARPDKVKALVLVEPAGVGDPAQVARMKDIPVMALYGDYIDQDSRWPSILKRQNDVNALIKQAGGNVEVIHLPERGIKGNSHMLMMDKNNLQAADVIINWLGEKGLWK